MKKFAIIFSILFISFTLQAQVLPKMQSVFIYNFTKYIKWPDSYLQGDFVIGVLGENAAITPELEEMARTKRAGSQAIKVQIFSDVANISKCHVLFIPKDKSTQISSCISKVGSNSTLIITEQEGYALKGAAINFVIRDNKQKFELNIANAERNNLKILESLKSLAIIVE